MRGRVHRRHEHDDQPGNDDHDAAPLHGPMVDRNLAQSIFIIGDPAAGRARAILS
jgi:hypothetical protein